MSDDREHWAQSTGEPEPGAPKGVRPISLEGLNQIGVDGAGNLYWLDTKILTAKKEFRLSFFQATVAVITAASAAIAASAAVYSAYLESATAEQAQAKTRVAVQKCDPEVGAVLRVDSPREAEGKPDFTTENCLLNNAHRFAALDVSFEDNVGAVVGACQWEISNHSSQSKVPEEHWIARARFRVAESRSSECLDPLQSRED